MGTNAIQNPRLQVHTNLRSVPIVLRKYPQKVFAITGTRLATADATGLALCLWAVLRGERYKDRMDAVRDKVLQRDRFGRASYCRPGPS